MCLIYNLEQFKVAFFRVWEHKTLKRRTEMTEEKVNSKKKKSELKDQLIEIIQSEKQKKDGKNK